MKVIMVFFILIGLFSCKKEKCYECTQRVKHSYNKDIEGYPKEFTSKFVSCGDNIYLVDKPEPIIINDTLGGDTVYTYWRDTDCKRR